MSQNVLIQNEQVVGGGVSHASQIPFDNTGTSLPNNVQGAISAVNVNLTQLFISLETATGTVTVGADSYLDLDVSPTIPSGYEVVSASIIQTSVPNTWLLPTLFRNSETRYTLYVRNLYSGGQLQGSYAVKFLLQKTSV